MSLRPVRPARIDFSDPQAPRSPEYGDIYHARAGALQQARHVFLRGNGLPGRWAGKPRFVILEAGFGLGNNFLATWAAWRDDPSRCEQLWFIGIDKHPPLATDLDRAHQGSPLVELAAQLRAQWPPCTPDLHRIDFDHGRVRLLLLWADLAQALPELMAAVDAFYLDGFAPRLNPGMWDWHALRRLHRLAAPAATLSTWSVAREVRDALASAGFDLAKVPGLGAKREMTVGHFAPRHTPALPPGRRAVAGPIPGEVIVIGGGLAGAAAAHALACQGVATQVLDRHAQAAQEASGNAGGLFHGVVHRHDGPHARWLRAAALWAHRHYAALVAAGLVQGQTDGLLRGEQQMSIAAMRALLEAQALPPQWVQAWSAEQAAARSATPWPGPAWYYPGGGWVSPADVTRQWLKHDRIRWRGGVEVQRLQAAGDAWTLFDANGTELARAGVVVLANAADAVRLLGTSPGPWHRTRGQVSLYHGAHPDIALPLADSGYALSMPDGRLLFGATSQAGDDDAEVRASDHAHNRATLQRLTGWSPPLDAALAGRVGWRMHAADRLPWLGPVPSFEAGAPGRRDQPRFIARQPGLVLLAGLGSRGITQAPLAGELLASWITGAPMSAPTSLVDALDVARFAARAARLNRS